MKITTQFCVFLENITDRTADICASLALEGINIVGLSIADAVDYGVARLVVDDPYSARGILQDSRYAFTEVSVLTVEAPHNPGALADCCARWSGRTCGWSMPTPRRPMAPPGRTW